MSLHDYARKRRFERTPEPAGSRSAAGTRPIFVVQLHHASTRHYDFRLEVDGVLKSWAVPKGPSLRAGEKRLAVEVEDHPLDYAGFEGAIPEGNYGAGHVQVFDHGFWACDGDPLTALAAGKLDFILHGDKLGGGWKLVRTRPRGRQPQWLLIKRDDAFARDQDADDLVDAPSPGKPRAAAGRGATPAPAVRKPSKQASERAKGATARKSVVRRTAAWRKRALALAGARVDAMPLGFAPQLATLRATPPAGDAWLHEIKWDGYRLLADLVDGAPRLRSRGGLDWNSSFPEVARALGQLPVDDACLDGELVVLGRDGHSDFSELQRAIAGTSKASLRYLVFDLPGLAGVDLRNTPLHARKTLLKSLLGRKPGVLAFSDHVVGHGREVFAQTGAKGFEGVVSKRVDSHYRAGRGGDWIKSKHAQGDDFIVVGYTRPKGARSGFGSLLMATREQGQLRYVGRVGTGFDDAALAHIHARLKPLQRAKAPVALPAHVPFAASSVHWVKPVLVAEVAYRGWGKEGLLRQAAFKRLREDKPAHEVVVQRLHAGDAGKARGARSRPPNRDAEPTDDNASRITHPERVMFTGAKYTKGDVAAYYRSIAPWILPGLARRPLSLLRCPDGSQGECFFQKHHADSLGRHVQAVALRQKSGREQYLYVDDVAGLIDLVQMGTLEFHPWGAQVAAPEAPDRLVFDLDPGPGVSWPAVVAAARDVRDKLGQAALASFVRLSGGKGLHVVVPIATGPSWDDARAFSQAFAQAMAVHAPGTYVATMAKAKRPQRIFIDWLRNARGATSVASWSLRARPGAPVAVPLRWEELGRIRRPDAFDLDRARRRAVRLRKDPWEGFDTLSQSLPDLSG
ncbi:MAG: DNA ligase D [Pseudomonadota bacterium]|nr:DNA ligase D [Pseudomonadota bacterium]